MSPAGGVVTGTGAGAAAAAAVDEATIPAEAALLVAPVTALDPDPDRSNLGTVLGRL